MLINCTDLLKFNIYIIVIIYVTIINHFTLLILYDYINQKYITIFYILFALTFYHNL